MVQYEVDIVQIMLHVMQLLLSILSAGKGSLCSGRTVLGVLLLKLLSPLSPCAA